MKKYISLYEDFKHEGNNHVQFMNWLMGANADEIRQAYVDGSINTPLKKQVAARSLGNLIANGKADDSVKELFHTLSDSLIS